MPPGKARNAHWASISRAAGRLVALGLVIYFLSQVVTAVRKLQNEQTGVSVTTHYEHSRLMPSISICFRNKKEHYQYNGTEVEQGLNITK